MQIYNLCRYGRGGRIVNAAEYGTSVIHKAQIVVLQIAPVPSNADHKPQGGSAGLSRRPLCLVHEIILRRT